MPTVERPKRHILLPMILPWTVNSRIDQMGGEIADEFADRSPIFVAVLKGGAVFDKGVTASAKRHGLVFDRGSIGISSYGQGTESNRHPEISQAIDVNVKGREVIGDEDIVDTGDTMAFFIRVMMDLGASAVFINTLLHKPSRERVHVPIYKRGFKIKDKFVVGHGIDYAELHRGISGIWEVKFI